MKHLVSTDWLEKNLDKVRIFDGSWHLPNTNRNALNEFLSAHIKNSNFFDIDKNSNLQSNLPHMLPKKETWEKIQNAKDPKDRNMCGHYGINGGKFDKNMKFGVNCYGVRPNKPEIDFTHPDLPKQKKKNNKKKKQIDDLVVVPYNRTRWQRDYASPVAEIYQES